MYVCLKIGLFDYDHTSKKVSRRDRESRSRSRERDKIHTPDSGRGKEIKGKGGAVKKVANKSTVGKAGAGSKGKNLKLRFSSHLILMLCLLWICFCAIEKKLWCAMYLKCVHILFGFLKEFISWYR